MTRICWNRHICYEKTLMNRCWTSALLLSRHVRFTAEWFVLEAFFLWFWVCACSKATAEVEADASTHDDGHIVQTVLHALLCASPLADGKRNTHYRLFSCCAFVVDDKREKRKKEKLIRESYNSICE